MGMVNQLQNFINIKVNDINKDNLYKERSKGLEL